MTRRIHATRHRGWMQAAVILAGLLVTASCSKVPLTAPTGSTITLLASRISTGLNSSVTVTAIVIESGGTPVHDGTVVYFYSTLGTMTPAQATTTNGQATVQFVSDTQSGSAAITARSGGASSTGSGTNQSAGLTITVGATAVGQVALSASPNTLPSTGGTSVLTATVSDISGNRLSGIPVTFSTDAGNFDQNGVRTDSSGLAVTRLTTLARASVTASVAGGASGTMTSAAQIINVRTAPNASFNTVALTGADATIVYSAFASVGGATIASVSITFGDGTSQSGLGVGNNVVIPHHYRGPGTYTLILTVTDAAGETATASSIVVVP